VHSNGFSLVRHLLKEHAIDLGSMFLSEGGAFCLYRGPTATVGDVLLIPTAIYSPLLRDLGEAVAVRAAAHITGGGFPDNVGRAVPDGLAAELDLASWSPGPVVKWLHSLGVSHDELLATFNCGLGMVVVMDAGHVEAALRLIGEHGHEGQVVGRVVPRGEGAAVRYTGALRL